MSLKRLTHVLIAGLIITLILLLLASAFPATLIGWVYPGSQINVPTGPLPLPPTLSVPRGAFPGGPVSFKEYKQLSGRDYELIGSGFLLVTSKGIVVGVTTAHSLSELGEAGLTHVGFGLPEATSVTLSFDTLHGLPGVARTGDDLTVDYVLLRPSQAIEPQWGLTPDPRGTPQAGEQVVLFGGLGELNGGRRVFTGTVLAVAETGFWVMMDENFEPGQMSGSPLLSAHTGQVVGMAIAAAQRDGRLLLAFHPIGHLLRQAEQAEVFPLIKDYQRH